MALNTVKLKKYQDINKEWLANAAITPGMLVQLMSTNKVRKHANESGNALPKMFALEDELQGKGIDDDYAQGDPVQVWIAQAGEEVNAILEDGNTVVIGDPLESAGDGTLQKMTADSTGVYYYNQIVAIALEAVDTAGSPAATTSRIHVMVV
jgi:hypothetical protein